MSVILGGCHHLTRAVEIYCCKKFSNSGFIPLNICFSGLRFLSIRNATLFAKSLSIKDGDVAKDGFFKLGKYKGDIEYGRQRLRPKRDCSIRGLTI